jgi:hypothetical protein
VSTRALSHPRRKVARHTWVSNSSSSSSSTNSYCSSSGSSSTTRCRSASRLGRNYGRGLVPPPVALRAAPYVALRLRGLTTCALSQGRAGRGGVRGGGGLSCARCSFM